MALADQVTHVLHECGETPAGSLIGGFTVRPQSDGSVRVFWRLGGLPVFDAFRYRRNLRRCERVLRAWGLATDLRLDGPEPSLVCRLTSQ